MKLNTNFNQFKKNYFNKKNQIVFNKIKCKDLSIFENIINNLLIFPDSFIFESVEGGKTRGRYTFVGIEPDKIWNFLKNSVFLKENSKNKKVSNKPYAYIKKLVKQFNFKLPGGLPPMSAVLAGYFSYDVIRYIEKIPNKCRDDLKIPDIRILRPTYMVVHDNLKKEIFFIANCFADQKIPDLNFKFKEIKNRLNMMKNFSFFNIFSKKNKKIIKNDIKVKSNISKNKFKKMVNKAKNYIKKGDIFQVVLSQRFETTLSKEPIEIYKKLRKTNPSPFMFFFNFSDFQIIGSSPEILVRLRNDKITVRPIAGTRPRGSTKKLDESFKKQLMNDKKELAEHLMLLDLGRNDVGKVSKINSVNVTEKFIVEKYSHVMHIVSNVVGKFDNKTEIIDTMLAGFPAGTVSGAPKIRAMEIIDKLETSKRKLYAGAVGYFAPNKSFDTCIALRTALAKNKKFYVQSGAGIVADSKPENEYKETVNKAKALLKAIE